jgi:small subunit ribosomal protein S3
MLLKDIEVREYLKKNPVQAFQKSSSRPAKNAKITIYTARPGVVIGKKGEDIEALRTS